MSEPVLLRANAKTATPTFIVRGSQDVGSWLQIDDFAPRKFAFPAERNIDASAGFAFEIELNIIQPAAVIDCAINIPASSGVPTVPSACSCIDFSSPFKNEME